ncbi:phosphotriesterase [Novosphingobium indicum]|uniref:Phosphotriesterase n=1 Tax=Novosphingobium indicum TaxID=462949 RepID=A0ABQ2J8F7_9SPHN|nr:phosphotriesterase [Novosphingobium indicum]GGN42374.1 phosphotriesterase [Novosphingobium indicum]
MAMIETARGTITSSDLGRVLIHEHVFLMDMEYTFNYRPDFFSDKTIDDAVARLDALKASGIDTIIDLTVLGLGRHMPSLAKAAAKTDLNIIVSTGAYTFDAVPAPFQFWGPGLLKDADVEPMIGHFVSDITEGIGGTGVKAGMLKCAIDEPGLQPGVERVMRAVARAHVMTGTPVTVHTAPLQQTGLIVQDVLTEEGVNLERVVIGHCGDTSDIDYLMKLADKGSILGMDRFGVEFAITMEERVKTIAQMVQRGYADQLTLSHDCCCWSDYFPDVSDYHQAMPNHHYLHIHNDVIPALLEAGVSQGDLDKMFVDNPRRLFAAPGKD